MVRSPEILPIKRFRVLCDDTSKPYDGVQCRALWALLQSEKKTRTNRWRPERAPSYTTKTLLSLSMSLFLRPSSTTRLKSRIARSICDFSESIRQRPWVRTVSKRKYNNQCPLFGSPFCKIAGYEDMAPDLGRSGVQKNFDGFTNVLAPLRKGVDIKACVGWSGLCKKRWLPTSDGAGPWSGIQKSRDLLHVSSSGARSGEFGVSSKNQIETAKVAANVAAPSRKEFDVKTCVG